MTTNATGEGWTPGPWFEDDRHIRPVAPNFEGRSYTIATVSTARKVFRADEVNANSRLIACAPAMNLILRVLAAGEARLEGSEFCFGGMRYSTCGGDWSEMLTTFGLWDRLSAALAKARGGAR